MSLKTILALSAIGLALLGLWDYRRTVERLAQAERALEAATREAKERARALREMQERGEEVKREVREMLDEAEDCESALRALRHRLHGHRPN